MNLDYKNIKFVGLVAKKTTNFTQNFNKLKNILSKYGVEILPEESIANKLNQTGHTLESIAKKSDFIISLGGDGTIISTCRKCCDFSPYVLGIHAGNLGFLTDITMEQTEDFFSEFFNGKFQIEEPFMLDVILKNNQEEEIHKIAFNDAVIMRAKPVSNALVDAYLNGEYFNSYFGDGVIATTPVGSTAYNMSSGGSIIYPLSDVFAITPICSHSLTQRPVILPKDFYVEFKAYKDEVLVIDGQDTFKMKDYDSIKVKLSQKRARLIRHIQRDYFQVLKEKLRWGQQ
ncbi:inorganic polyphosphate/ATP-NAD kinase [Campylobacter pinnipediorum subsp. pinnipediorum]|uniref:NAD(+) kinase n=1 Tax=Campylobacter pinnipediorum TaxID=1965231 RepID=UPI000994CCFB|nr:NAD(+) kinase [Campylobacter pinnipediorum]AQW84852.1 inorganic polyphosphate/ATP-NAD kinase [Campylobacter pinnipediorum subsp. pinnipediorum]